MENETMREFEKEWGVKRYCEALSDAMPYIIDLKKATIENLEGLRNKNPDAFKVLESFLLSVKKKQPEKEINVNVDASWLTEEMVVKGIARGFREFLEDQKYVACSPLSKSKIQEAIKRGVRDACPEHPSKKETE